jgi:hypothetical protein
MWSDRSKGFHRDKDGNTARKPPVVQHLSPRIGHGNVPPKKRLFFTKQTIKEEKTFCIGK